MELLLAGHPVDCGTCQKYLNCELQSLKQYLGVEESRVKRRSEAAAGQQQQPAVRLRPQQVRALRTLCAGLLRAARGGRALLQEAGQGVPHLHGRRRASGRVGLPFLRRLRRGVSHRGDPGQGRGAARARTARRPSCRARAPVRPRSTCPGMSASSRTATTPAAVAVITGEGALPAGPRLRLRSSLRERVPRGEINEPISIRELKRFAAEHDDRASGRERQLPRTPPASGWPSSAPARPG